ncbi:uncharacterized protein LOC128160950 [Crassostrea angulata]|uniref:uncharacterized protein LOC128160950 n=1 Tax=Magallana angulata TaxID=2784310 RepID=UPI0022B1F01C|nr:uncharacterized protein LOC128160950 [Crassostrea angulata]
MEFVLFGWRCEHDEMPVGCIKEEKKRSFHIFPECLSAINSREPFKFADLQRLFGKDFKSMTTNSILEEFMDAVIDELTSLFEKWKKKKFELCSYLNKEDFPKKIIVIVFC